MSNMRAVGGGHTHHLCHVFDIFDVVLQCLERTAFSVASWVEMLGVATALLATAPTLHNLLARAVHTRRLWWAQAPSCPPCPVSPEVSSSCSSVTCGNQSCPDVPVSSLVAGVATFAVLIFIAGTSLGLLVGCRLGKAGLLGSGRHVAAATSLAEDLSTPKCR